MKGLQEGTSSGSDNRALSDFPVNVGRVSKPAPRRFLNISNAFGRACWALFLIFEFAAAAQQRPVIVRQPALITYVAEHDTAIFAPTVTGDDLTFSWWMRSITEPAHAIPDDLGFEVHDMTLEVPNSLNNSSYNGVYWLVAANSAGVVQTRRARLVVVPEPQVIATSPDRVVRAGGSTIVWVKVAPDRAPSRTFQWFKDGVPIRAGRLLYLRKLQADAAGEYECVVTTIGGTTSASVLVSVQ